MRELVDFLRARLDATDEECCGADEYGDCRDKSEMRHREIEAKRRIIRLHEQDVIFGTDVLRLLALPYADHPDYDEAWRP